MSARSTGSGSGDPGVLPVPGRGIIAVQRVARRMDGSDAFFLVTSVVLLLVILLGIVLSFV
jgi:hypothetical protein